MQQNYPDKKKQKKNLGLITEIEEENDWTVGLNVCSFI